MGEWLFCALCIFANKDSKRKSKSILIPYYASFFQEPGVKIILFNEKGSYDKSGRFPNISIFNKDKKECGNTATMSSNRKQKKDIHGNVLFESELYACVIKFKLFNFCTKIIDLALRLSLLNMVS